LVDSIADVVWVFTSSLSSTDKGEKADKQPPALEMRRRLEAAFAAVLSSPNVASFATDSRSDREALGLMEAQGLPVSVARRLLPFAKCVVRGRSIHSDHSSAGNSTSSDEALRAVSVLQDLENVFYSSDAVLQLKKQQAGPTLTDDPPSSTIAPAPAPVVAVAPISAAPFPATSVDKSEKPKSAAPALNSILGSIGVKTRGSAAAVVPPTIPAKKTVETKQREALAASAAAAALAASTAAPAHTISQGGYKRRDLKKFKITLRRFDAAMRHLQELLALLSAASDSMPGLKMAFDPSLSLTEERGSVSISASNNLSAFDDDGLFFAIETVYESPHASTHASHSSHAASRGRGKVTRRRIAEGGSFSSLVLSSGSGSRLSGEVGGLQGLGNRVFCALRVKIDAVLQISLRTNGASVASAVDPPLDCMLYSSSTNPAAASLLFALRQGGIRVSRNSHQFLGSGRCGSVLDLLKFSRSCRVPFIVIVGDSFEVRITLTFYNSALQIFQLKSIFCTTRKRPGVWM